MRSLEFIKFLCIANLRFFSFWYFMTWRYFIIFCMISRYLCYRLHAQTRIASTIAPFSPLRSTTHPSRRHPPHPSSLQRLLIYVQRNKHHHNESMSQFDVCFVFAQINLWMTSNQYSNLNPKHPPNKFSLCIPPGYIRMSIFLIHLHCAAHTTTQISNIYSSRHYFD